MTPFTSVTGTAAFLDEDDIDTDIIFPARFLLLMDKTGLGKHAFHERRHNGRQGFPFILDKPPYDKATIFVAAKNFGTGSSREQAVWALADFGIRCIVAESFGEIFFANCFKNGILPIVKTGEELELIRQAALAARPMTVDLVDQTIAIGAASTLPFDVDPFRKSTLLSGLDEIGGILAKDADDIDAFELRQRAESPWLHLDHERLSHFDDLKAETALG